VEGSLQLRLQETKVKEHVSDWAAKNEIQLSWPEEFGVKTGGAFYSLAEQYNFQKNFCIDYGKFIEAVPFFV
jgi:hypothetical protein